MTSALKVTFEAGDTRATVTGQTARTLIALVTAGARGVTAAEVSCWALRLAAYCFVLRRKFNLIIETVREPHDGGWHGRHILQTPVRLLDAASEVEDTQ